jgi:pyrimidine operon attenuation protein/uracil phosphoribosyltransferase
MFSISGISQVSVTQTKPLKGYLNKYCHKQNVSFGAGRLNILATADNHGHFETLPEVYSNVVRHIDKIFPDKNKPGTRNVLTIAGDWFIDLKQKGYKTRNDPEKLGFSSGDVPEMTAGFYNIYMLNKFTECLNKILTSKNNPEQPKLKTVYTPGNHCLEDGDSYLASILKYSNKDMSTVVSNINLASSPAFNQFKSIKEKEIIEIPDDKDKNKVHKVLMLGLTVNTVDFYCKGKASGLDVLDRSAKKTEQLQYPEDVKETIQRLYKNINEFKSQNPQGGVVIINHNGNPFANAIIQGIDQLSTSNGKNYKVDALLNGHDHRDQTTYIGKNKTPVVSLSQNNQKLGTVKLLFDDNGKLTVETSRLDVDKNISEQKNPLKRVLNRLLRDDFKLNISIKVTDKDGKPLDKMKELSCEDIRFTNNAMANFLTDTLLKMTRKYDPSVEIFGISSSAIRGNLPVNGKKASNMNLIGVLCGITDEDSKIYKANLSGKDLMQIILKNVYGNMHNKTRNELIQWSGIQINRDKIIETMNAHSFKPDQFNESNLSDYDGLINIRMPGDSNYQPVDLNKVYRVALPAEALRSKLVEFKDAFTPLSDQDIRAKQLLKDSFEDAGNNIVITDPGADIRVITADNDSEGFIKTLSLNLLDDNRQLVA